MAQRGSSENALLGVNFPEVATLQNEPFWILEFVAGNWSLCLHELCSGPISSQNLELLIWFDEQAHVLNGKNGRRFLAATCWSKGCPRQTDAESMQLRDRKRPLLQSCASWKVRSKKLFRHQTSSSECKIRVTVWCYYRPYPKNKTCSRRCTQQSGKPPTKLRRYNGNVSKQTKKLKISTSQ